MSGILVVWILVVGGYGKAVIPYEFQSKEECVSAGMSAANGYSEIEAMGKSDFYCIPVKSKEK